MKEHTVSPIRSHIFNGTILRTSSRRLRDNRCTPRKTCSCVTLSITNPTRIGLGSDRTRVTAVGSRRATHRLSHMADCQPSIRRDVLMARAARNLNLVKYSPNRLVLLQHMNWCIDDTVDSWCFDDTLGILG